MKSGARLSLVTRGLTKHLRSALEEVRFISSSVLTEGSHKPFTFLLLFERRSGHFCGMAEMLTPVGVLSLGAPHPNPLQIDYTRSSNVWAASDKWKGVFKVKWIFVRDIPNITLRHIKLLYGFRCQGAVG